MVVWQPSCTEFWCDWLGRGFGVLRLPGSCWLFSMPDALRDGVSWGREEVMGAGGHVEGKGREGGVLN